MEEISKILERLSNAKDNQQFKQSLAAFYTNYRKNLETIEKIQYIEEIWALGKGKRRR